METKSNNYSFRRTVIIGILIFLAILLGIFAGLCLGATVYTPLQVKQVLSVKLFSADPALIDNASAVILWNLRMPRIIMSLLIGGGLAVAGVAIQALTQNIMADPYILGAASGASVFVALAYLIGGTLLVTSTVFVPMMAFIGATLALILVYMIGATGANVSQIRLILAGLAVSTVLHAVTRLLFEMVSDQVLRGLTNWFIGSVAGARWNTLLVPLLGISACFIYFWSMSNAFNLLTLGDDTAISLGLNVKKFKKIAIIAISLVTGIAVSACGIIGFVGFIIPHIVRILNGADHRKLIPLSFLAGAMFLLWMDILSRTLFAPSETSIGIFTSLVGGPFFVWLIYRKNKFGKI